MIFAGIDVGFSGAIAIIDAERKLLELVDMPTLKVGTRHEYDIAACAALLPPADGVFVALEHQHAMPKQGVNSMFTLGGGYMMWLTILTVGGYSFEVVRAKEWQRIAGVPKRSDKRGAAWIAMRFWPDAEIKGPRGGLLDGRSDALLIADYARRSTLGLTLSRVGGR